MTNYSRNFAQLVTILVGLFTATGAAAADIHIRVIDAAKSTPLNDAAVCLGTPADPDQFGALRTDMQGNVSFSGVPATPLMLTVSRDQYRGYRVQHGAKRFDVVIEVGLQTGGLGPTCDAPLSAGTAEQTRLAISEFSINAGQRVTNRRDVSIAALVAGGPTHFRVSERADFSDAEWQPFALPARFQLSRTRGAKTVYFQVRRFRSSGEASMQSVSEIARADIALQ
ncbi:MAG: carboxypeptidase regulatory-like domain-containing protein [Gammaproteobacteria bacterium]|nr:carboxypeptidase regulatory-like domain-containing protein [Gammaproteobacteria bacterium]